MTPLVVETTNIDVTRKHANVSHATEIVRHTHEEGW